ncbi:hypothetical protein SAMN05444339_1108 [Loktanella atrilutea]|uniref:Uncharacterized protein n=1 Tax=Loktanella atrilutea TaxID=366533 RepID=A0A1M5DII7_LOKAT|nr:hypothetical protein [Loktanella atrilutea]SHF66838.1 hypothetical protein SAMN05444339_1108 [Loktanella atrilutea]
MIPGSLSSAVGVLFCIASLACVAIGMASTTRGICEIVRAIRTGVDTEHDNGTAAVMFALAFVLFMLMQVAVA